MQFFSKIYVQNYEQDFGANHSTHLLKKVVFIAEKTQNQLTIFFHAVKEVKQSPGTVYLHAYLATDINQMLRLLIGKGVNAFMILVVQWQYVHAWRWSKFGSEIAAMDTTKST